MSADDKVTVTVEVTRAEALMVAENLGIDSDFFADKEGYKWARWTLRNVCEAFRKAAEQ